MILPQRCSLLFFYSPRVTASTLGRWEYGRFLYTCSMIFSFTCEMVSQFSTLTNVTSGPSPWTNTCKFWQARHRRRHQDGVETTRAAHGEHAEIFKRVRATSLPPTRAELSWDAVVMATGFLKSAHKHRHCGDTWHDLGWLMTKAQQEQTLTLPIAPLTLCQLGKRRLTTRQTQRRSSQTDPNSSLMSSFASEVKVKSLLWIEAGRKHCICLWNSACCMFFPSCNLIAEGDPSLQETCNSV